MLTYKDIDGDAVKVTFTHATMATSDFLFDTGDAMGSTGPQALDTVRLVDKTGVGFTLTATPQVIGGHLMGDSHANIGLINGTNTDLGTISVDGNVQNINAGTGAAGTVGLKTFTALSIGTASDGYSFSNVGINNAGSFVVKGDVTNAIYNFTGGVKSLTVGGNIVGFTPGNTTDAGFNITGDVGTLKVGGSLIDRTGTAPNLHVTGKVGVLTIGGSVVGGSADLANALHQIEISGGVKTLTIGGDLAGGPGSGTGAVHIGGDVTAAKIGGSMKGGAGTASGAVIIDGKTNAFTLGGSVIGDRGTDSALLKLYNGAGAVKIGGSLLGGTNSFSGELFAAAGVTSIAIGHNLQAADNPGSGTLSGEGSIEVEGNLGSIIIGGDFISGRSVGGGALQTSGVIGATGTIGAVKIGGSILGDPGHLAYITAGANGTNGAVKAIASITVKGSVQSASLLAGYDYLFQRFNHDSGIGSVSVGGNFTGSYITAGAAAGSDGIPGNHDDGADSAVATLGSVKIGGALTGLDGVTNAFYILASIVNRATIGHAIYTHAQIHAGPIEFDSIGNAAIISAD